MSTPEQPQVETRSSIKVVRNAKGDPQFELKVVEGCDGHELARLHALAVRGFWALTSDLANGPAHT